MFIARIPSLNRSHRSVLGSAFLLSLLAACSSEHNSTGERVHGQSDFTSSSPQGAGRGGGIEATDGNAASGGFDAQPAGSGSKSSSTPRTVEETDIYRLEGDRLYFLNGYRGLMVFDVSDVDHPRFLGRSPIYGTPVEMVVRGGVASVVVSDWYGKMEDGTPFHGSIVRGIDARDPANMRIVGEAQLGGSVRDTRVVGEVIYAVTQKEPWSYGWYALADSGSSGVAVGGAGAGTQVTVTSVSFKDGVIALKDNYEAPGSNGIFYVTSQAILLANSEVGSPDQYGYAATTGDSRLSYVDISDAEGQISVRGNLTFHGYMNGWGTDNGRWNLDFADGKTAHALACGEQWCGSGQALTLATADFTNPDSPQLLSQVAIPGNTWSPAVRFDSGRMYLAPSNGYVYTGTGVQNTATPIQIFDLSNPASPALKGTAEVTGQIWNFIPAGDRLFALGNRYQADQANYYGSEVALHYLDVSNPASPATLGTAAFGQGWAWTPAAGTFKAFTKSDEQNLVVLPFSGYDSVDYRYNNGLQLIEFTPTTITTSGTAQTHGWVERGIFVKNRLVSLSDLALAVVDYTDHSSPAVVAELTLARNVVNAKPQTGGTVAELSSDWWDNDVKESTLRILDGKDVEEIGKDATLAELSIPGINAQIFHDGTLSYVVSQISRRGPCPEDSSGGVRPVKGGTSTENQCEFWHKHVEVVDRSQQSPVVRGVVDLPENGYDGGWGWGWGWWGCYANDWYYGSQLVQVNQHVLAFQQWTPSEDGGQTGQQKLVTINLEDPDQPVVGETPIVDDTSYWWGNLRSVKDQLYAGHYEWLTQPSYASNNYNPGTVRYYLDRISLKNPQQPEVTARINVPGVLVGASEDDPNLIYTIDYRWWGDRGSNEFAVSALEGDLAYLQGTVKIPGYVGNVFVRGSRAYFTVQEDVLDSGGKSTGSQLKLYQANLSDPLHPALLPSTPSEGWGWLLAVEGDRAFVTSGFNDESGFDVYKLSADQPPAFDQFVRVRGWYPGSLARQNNDLFLATGYWGTEHITLK